MHDEELVKCWYYVILVISTFSCPLSRRLTVDDNAKPTVGAGFAIGLEGGGSRPRPRVE